MTAFTLQQTAFRAALAADGLDYPGEIIPDGRLHRIQANGDRNPNSFYLFHPDGIAAGLSVEMITYDRYQAILAESV